MPFKLKGKAQVISNYMYLEQWSIQPHCNYCTKQIHS